MTSADDIFSTFQATIDAEAQALLAFKDAIPQDFESAVHCILECTGKVIVSGVGKSGHVGGKMAATLASTGSPAFFVHPTEASHGDLGMIQAGDCCLLISNSGETAELLDTIHYCKRFSIPLIGISSKEHSTLMQAADHRLLIPAPPEACPIRMAPMTSTTLTLVLGDALAASLMTLRGFKDTDFGVFHPGGKLGAQMMRVDQLMHTGAEVPLVAAEASMHEAVLTMSEKGFGTAAVTQGDTLVGVISDGDLRRNIHDLFDRSAGETMTIDPITVAPETLAAEALAIMNEHAISVLMVVEDQKPIGVIHMHDLLRAGVA